MNPIKRREFLKRSGAIWLSASGLQTFGLEYLQERVKMRFAVASDGHYGQNGTSFEEHFSKIVNHLNDFHAKLSLDFCVINGDIIHDMPEFLLPAAASIKKLTMPWMVTRGNHDMVTAESWQEAWAMPLNTTRIIKKSGIICCDTSDIKGAYLSPDLSWLESALEGFKKLKNVFLFLHIPQKKWTSNAIENPAFFELVSRYKNIRAIFHGHEHDQDGYKVQDSIPCFFDAHFGGNWGTNYKGYRVVELLENGELVTWIMNPLEKINLSTHS